MEMYYDGALVMPNNYAVVNEEEMTYVEGGARVYLSSSCLNKDKCMAIASNFTNSTGLSQKRIAMEIYAHALLYLGGMTALIVSIINDFHLADSAINYIINHSNPVDIGGDNFARVAVYNALWLVPSLT